MIYYILIILLATHKKCKKKWIITGNFSGSSRCSSNTSADVDVDVKAAIENTKYYLNKIGKMQTGWQKIGGKWYYMDKNGALQESKWISGIYYVKVDGQSVRLMKDRKAFLPPGKSHGSGSWWGTKQTVSSDLSVWPPVPHGTCACNVPSTLRSSDLQNMMFLNFDFSGTKR